MTQKLKTVARMISERKFVILNVVTPYKDATMASVLCHNLYNRNGHAGMGLLFESELLAVIFSCGTIFLRKSRHHACNVTLTVDEFESLLEETTDRYNLMLMSNDEHPIQEEDSVLGVDFFNDKIRDSCLSTILSSEVGNDRFEGNVGTFKHLTENPEDDNYSTNTFSSRED